MSSTGTVCKYIFLAVFLQEPYQLTDSILWRGEFGGERDEIVKAVSFEITGGTKLCK